MPVVDIQQGSSRQLTLECIASCLEVPGEFWECGVYQGRTAALIKSAIGNHRTLRLFDTFSECPPSTPEDEGVDSRVRWPWSTSLGEVAARVGGSNVYFHVGRIPETFAGLERVQIAFAYLDLTLYQGTKDALAFIIPRLVGKVLVRDYYGSAVKWPGLVRAVDESGVLLERHGYDAVVNGDYQCQL